MRGKKAGLEHAIKRAIERARGDQDLWIRVATILSNNMDLARQVLPNVGHVRIVSRTGQLIVENGVVSTFFADSSNRWPGQTEVHLAHVIALLDRLIEREGEGVVLYKPEKGKRVTKEKIIQEKAIALKDVVAFVAGFEHGVDLITVSIQFTAFEGRRSLSFGRIIEMAVQYGQLTNENGWVSLPKKGK